MPRFLPHLAMAACLASMVAAPLAWADDPWLVVEGAAGPGKGKHIVLVSGDEEYRSEEALPQLAKILARHHGFRCTVLFAIDPKDGAIDPNVNNNIPGLAALDDADLLVLFTRFRKLPDEQMRHIADYVESGRPIIGMRTSTHGFDLPAGSTYARYGWNNSQWNGGFGRHVLGETWINHHGHHGHESTRGVIAPGAAEHPILRGIAAGDIWGPTDVYGVRLPLDEHCQPLVLGQVLTGMKPDDPPVAGKKNDPMMPVAWTRKFNTPAGKEARVFATTMGASQDLQSEGLRRLLVNACYWGLGLEDQIPERSEVGLVGDFAPSPFKFGGARRNMRPADYAK
jgi:type 1 glutamine amidotransferase